METEEAQRHTKTQGEKERDRDTEREMAPKEPSKSYPGHNSME